MMFADLLEAFVEKDVINEEISEDYEDVEMLSGITQDVTTGEEIGSGRKLPKDCSHEGLRYVAGFSSF